MSMRARRALLLLMAVFLTSGAYAGQSNSPAPSSDRIYLNVVVTHKSGPPVGDLQQQDFTVLDNKKPQPITSFRVLGGSQVPLEVVLVIDSVNVDYQVIAYERSQVDKFLRAEGGQLSHSTSVMLLTDTGLQSIADFSNDGNKLSSSLDQSVIGLRFLQRSSGFYGAAERFQISLNGLHELAAREAPKPGRKFILFVSPGWPLLSGPEVQLDDRKRQQLFGDIVYFSTALRRDGVTLYAIDPIGTRESVDRNTYWQNFSNGISKPGQVEAGDLGLQVIATQSGGLVLNSSNDITGMLQNCLADARAYYEISFAPAPGDRPNEYHRLQVRVAKSGLTARTWQGYYSQPQVGSAPSVPQPNKAR
jgi:VWFA-related protein